MLYPGQIAYNPKSISKTKKTVLKSSQSSPAEFVSLCMAKSHKNKI